MAGLGLMESSKETGCQVPEVPILCINNCGFFGSTATMNMCSKCHKDTALKQQQAKLATSSIEDIVNSSSSTNKNELFLAEAANAELELKVVSPQQSSELGNELGNGHGSDTKAKEGPNRCATCRKRVGLTGFNCRCGHMLCSVHRYSDKHNCRFDYRVAAQDAIAKANPVVKSEKLNKI